MLQRQRTLGRGRYAILNFDSISLWKKPIIIVPWPFLDVDILIQLINVLLSCDDSHVGYQALKKLRKGFQPVS